jgi:hypothetical protein
MEIALHKMTPHQEITRNFQVDVRSENLHQGKCPSYTLGFSEGYYPLVNACPSRPPLI